MASHDLVRSARPILEDLAERTRETVNLGVLSGDAVVYIDQVTGTRSIVAVSWVGRRTPLHCTSNGKVLLAFMREDERDRLLARAAPRPDAARRHRSGDAPHPARGDPRPRLRPDDGGARGGPERRGGAGPPGRRRGRRRAQRVGPGVPDAARRPAAGRPSSRWRPPRSISRRLGYVERAERPPRDETQEDDDDDHVGRAPPEFTIAARGDRPHAARAAAARRARPAWSSSRRSSGTAPPAR